MPVRAAKEQQVRKMLDVCFSSYFIHFHHVYHFQHFFPFIYVKHAGTITDVRMTAFTVKASFFIMTELKLVDREH